MTVDVPLINDYKKSFVSRRLLITILGGFTLPKTRLFCVSLLLQGIIYLLPLFVDILVSLTLKDPLGIYIIAIIHVFLFVLTTGSIYIYSQRATNEAPSSLEEEGEPILPPKKHKVNIVLHALAYGAYGSIMHSYLDYESIQNVFPSYGPVILIFSWYSSLNASFSLVVGSMPETAIFRPLDPYEISSLSRPFIATLTALPFYLSSSIQHHAVLLRASYIAYSCLPLLWISGMLPTLEPLVLWAGEQIQVHVLGGTPSSSWSRFIAQYVLSATGFMAAYVSKDRPKEYFAFASALGFILSLDLFGMAQSLFQRCSYSSKIFPQSNPFHTYKVSNSLTVKRAFFLLLLLSLTIALSLLQIPSSPELLTGLGATNVVIFALLNVLNCFDNVYIFFGTLRSPLYCVKPTPGTIKDGQHDEPLFKIVLKHIRSILTKYFIPLYLLMYAKLLIQDREPDFQRSTPMLILDCAGVVRIMRYIWQFTSFSLTELTIHYVLSLLGTWTWLGLSIGPPIELMIVGLLRDRFMTFVKKLYFVTVCSVSSLEERVSKRSYAGCLFQFNIVISPLILCLVIISSIFQCPLYAFFSLPIFGLAFPRSKRFWPESPSESSSTEGDAIYYEQMSDSFLSSLHERLECGKLYGYQPGDHFLARYEDKILWTSVLESGNGYAIYRLKGTELQHTSCHSLEATRIDDIFRVTFEEDRPLNKFAFHSLTPIGIIKVKTYSDTQNVLTGIIEASDTLSLVAQLFLKTLPWYLMTHLKDSQSQAKILSSGVTLKSDSVEAINLASWPPSSNESTLVETLRQSAYIKTNPVPREKKDNSEGDDSLSDFEVDEDLPITPARRKGLLPPLGHEPVKQRGSSESLTEQLENLFIPGGIEHEDVFVKGRRKYSSNITSITPPRSPLKSKPSDLPIPPTSWLHFPSASAIRKEEIRSEIDNEWLAYLSKKLFDTLEPSIKIYKTIIAGCFSSVYESSFDISGLGPGLLVSAFASRLGHLSHSLPEELKECVLLPSLKTAIKLALDDKILYTNLSEASHEELFLAIAELQSNWYLGSDTDEEWRDSVRREVHHLFSLSGIEGRSTNTLYRSRILTLTRGDVALGRLNSELVHGLWASLNLELLYLTNDDDERYSIQAEERLLRNLTVQVADPPLGYAIFASAPIRKGFH